MATEVSVADPSTRMHGTASVCVLCGLTAFPGVLHYCSAEARIREIIREEIARSQATVDGDA